MNESAANHNIIKIVCLTGFLLLLLLLDGRSVRSVSLFGFTDTGQQLGEIPDGVASIAIGDMDNDGDLDLVLASHEQDTIIQLYYNDGMGIFTRTNNLFPVTVDPNPLWNFGIVLRDFDRDGFLDIAAADAWRGVNIYLNSATGTFSWTQAILVPAVNEVKGIDAADVDADGDDDLVFGGHNGIPDRGDRIYLNDGAGHFVDSGQRLCFDVTWNTVFGDMDNDLDFDFVSVNRYREHPGRIHVNSGLGDFTNAIEITTTQTDDSFDIKLADLNVDGLLDVVIANSTYVTDSTTSKVFLNAGNLELNLVDGQLGTPNCETKSLELIDMTNDGDCDAVLGNWNGHSMIYENDGTGEFTKLDSAPTTSKTTAIGSSDLNGDGFIDIVAGSAADGHYHIYVNDGVGLVNTVPPLPPNGLTAESGLGQVYLSWNPGFDPSDEYLHLVYGRGSIDCASRIFPTDTINIVTNPGHISSFQTTMNAYPGRFEGGRYLYTPEALEQLSYNRTYSNHQEGTPQEGLTYNLRLGTAPDTYDLISGVSAHGLGQLGHRQTHFLWRLEAGTYYWSMQTVDAGFAKSEWSEEAWFTVAPMLRIYLPLILKQ